ncbi:hypothetical protein, variant [Allomyces macrogynus ATCC 38327]|uniref:PPM-type phosphatase domain-containing protein n=1 Tax=Allomyces macrogynus (strain ATCC 38327) TaxID=578462 RepID=A0A0L0S5L1_ALLM3|nr:hypothetical protein, variant [Allomyces macrogynus ATCC 38327]|eukprot:KNE57706.1 hypothetical protein, variant [Allomyces macrogynus ATCC 38327]
MSTDQIESIFQGAAASEQTAIVCSATLRPKLTALLAAIAAKVYGDAAQPNTSNARGLVNFDPTQHAQDVPFSKNPPTLSSPELFNMADNTPTAAPPPTSASAPATSNGSRPSTPGKVRKAGHARSKSADPPTTAGTRVDMRNYTAYVAARRAQGSRPEQQDETFVVPVAPGILVAGVLDGHGSDGGKASRFSRQVIERDLPTHLRAVATLDEAAVRAALTRTFQDANARLFDEPGIDCYLSGTTAVVAVLTQELCVVANVGDSRAMLAQVDAEGSADESGTVPLNTVPLTTDHNCENPTELARVQAAGARVDRVQTDCPTDPQGPLRIYKGTLPYPGLVVTRSLGDAVARRLGVHADPEITVRRIDPAADRAIVLASDGVWDGLPEPGRVARLVGNAARGGPASAKVADRACASVVSEALRGLDVLEIDDNVSAVCVLIAPLATGTAGAAS